jgi:hypothetical protein
VISRTGAPEGGALLLEAWAIGKQRLMRRGSLKDLEKKKRENLKPTPP